MAPGKAVGATTVVSLDFGIHFMAGLAGVVAGMTAGVVAAVGATNVGAGLSVVSLDDFGIHFGIHFMAGLAGVVAGTTAGVVTAVGAASVGAGLSVVSLDFGVRFTGLGPATCGGIDSLLGINDFFRIAGLNGPNGLPGVSIEHRRSSSLRSGGCGPYLLTSVSRRVCSSPA